MVFMSYAKCIKYACIYYKSIRLQLIIVQCLLNDNISFVFQSRSYFNEPIVLIIHIPIYIVVRIPAFFLAILNLAATF